MVKETLINSSPRRKPGSRSLISLDSGLRRNDGCVFVQRILNKQGLLALVVAFTVLGCATSTAKEEGSWGNKRFLPYVEASEIPDSDRQPIWISNTEVAFNIRKPGVMELTQAQRDEILGGSLPDYWRSNWVAWHEAWILDSETGKTRHYTDGTLVSYRNGVITISLESYKKRRPAPSEPKEQTEYSVLLEGPMGQEKRVVRPWVDYRQPRKCPGEPADRKPGVRRHLNPQHGCIDTLYMEATPNEPAIYYRSDGQKIELKMSRADIGSINAITHNWIDWLGAYWLKESTVMGKGVNGDSTQSIPLMKPDGRLLLVPLEVWGVNMAEPTRAGMIGFIWGHGRPKNDGLYLWQGKSILHIAENYIEPHGVSVSPNGCKVAYRSAWNDPWLGASPDKYRLRVIDLCRSLNLPSDANPFVWQPVSNN